MKIFKQTFVAIGPELTNLGVIKTTTQHSPLKNGDPSTLKLARELYGADVTRVDLTHTDVSR